MTKADCLINLKQTNLYLGRWGDSEFVDLASFSSNQIRVVGIYGADEEDYEIARGQRPGRVVFVNKTGHTVNFYYNQEDTQVSIHLGPEQAMYIDEYYVPSVDEYYLAVEVV